MTKIKEDYVNWLSFIGSFGPVFWVILTLFDFKNVFGIFLSFIAWGCLIALGLSWIVKSWNFACDIKTTETIQKNNIYGASLTLIIGLLFIGVSVAWTMNIYSFIDKAKTADGVVIVTEHATWHPRVEYIAESGEKRWFLTNDGVSGYRIFNYKNGKHVKVFYNHDNPTRNHIDDFIYTYSVPAIGIMAGSIFVFFSYAVLFGTFIIKKGDSFRATALIFGGVIFLTIAVFCAQYSSKFISKAKVTNGEVVGPSGSLNYFGCHPDINYVDESGKKRWIPANGLISGYKKGDRVRVLYDPQNLKDAKLDDFGSLYAWSYITIYFSIVAIVLGIRSLFAID